MLLRTLRYFVFATSFPFEPCHLEPHPLELCHLEPAGKDTLHQQQPGREIFEIGDYATSQIVQISRPGCC